ncbi:hypothetical protein COCMIDRAFT_3039 [Bipolaris oryzae ATCC 44560]|uniref:Coenzyme Q-binding protein COQ10 START domain-containing protein n=1 Tax=Bipolaris oryzae ATCC 44560 TaxID=930090 RepID=W6ZKQ3_COCMI|nr:uncharacterized protein COCMIDRAFT_3039 [Bipolaris oryzae ATCC 44560]EUC48079.1 hypothetical protein COCMIDRAFT_3039 [Bipolaris oryzae ATCC 44560]
MASQESGMIQLLALFFASPAFAQYTNLPNVKPGVFEASTRIEIYNTNFDAVWDLLTDFPNYAAWNPFVRYAVVTSPLNITLPEQRPAEGKNLYFRVQIPSLPLPVDKDTPDNPLHTQSSQELVTAVQRDLGRLAWEFWPPSVMLSAERWQAITDYGNGTVLYESREVFNGPLAYVIKTTMGDALQASFVGQGEGIKLYLESR